MGEKVSRNVEPFMLPMRSYSCLPKNFEFCLDAVPNSNNGAQWNQKYYARACQASQQRISCGRVCSFKVRSDTWYQDPTVGWYVFVD